MAMVKLSGQIVDIEGKSGGVVWRSDSCGAHVQKLPVQWHREPTPKQLKVRKCWRLMWRFWRESIDDVTLQLWSEYGKTHSRHNKKGELIKWSGWFWFAHFNMPRCLKEEEPLYAPPN